MNHPYQWTEHLDKNLNREILELTHVINQRNLTNIDRKVHPHMKEYTFSTYSRTFSVIDHIHKASPSRYRKIEIIPYILSDYED